MEYDIKNMPEKNCPPVNCNQVKDNCCGITKVVIAAVLGDDSETSKVKPYNGAYCNKIVEYEANGAIYFYSSDGIYTKLGNKLPSAGVASIEYVDTQDRKVLKDAKDYADAGDTATLQLATSQAQTREAQVLQDAKNYADGKDATTLSTAKGYTDSEIAAEDLLLKGYADSGDAATLQAAKDYTDSAASGVVTKNYVDNGDANTLSTAKNYTDSEVGGLEASLATVATSGDYSDLINTPVVPNITVTSVDPGEGAALAANNFIFVYDGNGV